MLDKELFTTCETEARYAYPKSSQAKDRMHGRGPVFIKRGRSVFYRREDLDRWFDGLKRKSTLDKSNAA